MVAINKGQHIEPLLRNSRSFVLCQISESDRFLLRKFGQTSSIACAGNPTANANGSGNGHDSGKPDRRPMRSIARDDIDDGELHEDDDEFDPLPGATSLAHRHDDDPLVTMTTSVAPSGAPIVDRAMTYLDCEIVRHVELESDYRIYVGQVHAGALLHKGTPAIQFGGNGFTP
jgi:hypothetical protein